MAICAQTRVKLLASEMACGAVIAYPTEAVWGLGCDPFNQHAVEKILQLKQRSVTKGVILIAGDISHLDFLLHDLSDKQKATLNATWPGAHTWLVPHQNRVPYFIHGQFDTVAVRVSNHPTVRALCNAFGGAIVSTSANPQGLKPATTQLRARSYFGTQIDYCPGKVGKNRNPSQIQHLLTGEIVCPA